MLTHRRGERWPPWLPRVPGKLERSVGGAREGPRRGCAPLRGRKPRGRGGRERRPARWGTRSKAGGCVTGAGLGGDAWSICDSASRCAWTRLIPSPPGCNFSPSKNDLGNFNSLYTHSITYHQIIFTIRTTNYTQPAYSGHAAPAGCGEVLPPPPAPRDG